MMLNETIKSSTDAIKRRRVILETKQHAEIYEKALAQLVQTAEGIKNMLDCACAMRESGIVCHPLMDEATRSGLLNCISDCGNGISEMSLTLETVKLLKSCGDTVFTQIKLIWIDAAAKYSDGTKGYLSLIGGLSDDPQKAKKLTDSIGKAVVSEPSVMAINGLVADVAAAKTITESFALNTTIETFLQKVSAQQASVMDLTPEILTWLNDKQLVSKLKVRF